ncbi:TPA: hypothetical protein ACH3X1_005573 [Trebouxia sp. C0004]
MKLRRSLIAVVACLHLLEVPLSYAWSCNLTMIGSKIQPQKLSAAQTSLECDPGADEMGTTLTVGVSQGLREDRSETFLGTGVLAVPVPDFTDSTLLYFQQSNVTIQEAHLKDIDAGNLSYILSFDTCSGLAIISLTSTRCNAQDSVVLVSNSSSGDDQGQVNLQRLQFYDTLCTAVVVINSSTMVSDSVFDSAFFDSNVTYSNGSGLIVNNTDGSQLALWSSTFSNNYAGNGSAAALQLVSGTFTVQNTTFVNNTSHQSGGAVIVGNPANDLQGKFVDCLFENNSALADGDGGGVMLLLGYEYTTHVQFNDCTFIGNYAKHGGAISAWGIDFVAVIGCTFMRNSVGGVGEGGGMYVYGYDTRKTVLYILNSHFVQNIGTHAPATAGVHAMSCRCVGLMNNTFVDNQGIGVAIDDGQGGCEVDLNGEILAYPPLFNRSTIANNGTGFLDNFFHPTAVESACVDIRNCSFVRNIDSTFLGPVDNKDVATQLRGGAGLSLMKNSRGFLVDLHFEDNKALQGGAMLLDTSADFIIWNNTFIGNLATHGGGAIATVNNDVHQGDTGDIGTLLLGVSTFYNNTAQTGGGIYGTGDANIVITNSTTFTANTAATGGAVSCVNCHNLTLLLDVEMTANYAVQSGGGCYFDGGQSFSSHSVHYTNNWAAKGGGAYIGAIGATTVTQANFTASTFDLNAANGTSFGGGGALYLDSGVTLLTNNIFQDNQATGYGGALAYTFECFDPSVVPGGQPDNAYMWQEFEPPVGACPCLVRSVGDSFVGNQASVAGGAVYATDMATLQMSCSSGLPSNNITGCSKPAWDDNAVQALVQSPNAEQGGSHGYGGVMAYPPFSITLDGEPDMLYISDGITLFNITARVHDIAGNLVTAGVSEDSQQSLVATVNVTGIPNLPVGVPTPALPGHTQGAADITGIINITDIVLVAYPWVYNLSVTLTGFPQVPAAWKMVHVQNCTTGQVQQNAAICSTCPAATFSLNPLNGSCDACPAGATCFGGSHFIPPSQSWHSGPYSTNIVQCPNAKACQGNRTMLLNCKENAGSCNMTAGMDTSQSGSYMIRECSPGHYGPVCSLCLMHDLPPGHTKYGRTGPLDCKPCRSAVAIVLAYIASTLLVVSWLLYTIHVTLNENREDAEEGVRPERVSELLKAVTLWLQYTSLLAGVNVPAPATLHWVFIAVNFAFSTVTSSSLSIDCLLSRSLNAALQRILVHLSVPLFVLAAMVLIQVVWWAITLSKVSLSTSSWTQAMIPVSQTLRTWQGNIVELQRRLLVTLLTVLFFYYPSLLTTILSLFACYRIDASSPNGAYPQFARATWAWGYWLPDMSIRCFVGWHLRLSLGRMDCFDPTPD